VNESDALAWLYGTQSVGIKLGLENIRRLLVELGIQPWLDSGTVRVIHVAGTNGKGSVCAMADAVVRAAGFRSGLYTSPHLVAFGERIRINGAPISGAGIAEGLSRIRALVASWEYCPTFFEIATALALLWFQQQQAEVVVLETGLGGRLDATNAVRPAACAIVSIGMDHWQYLGNTLRQIALEKAGIFKPGVPVVALEQAPEAAEALRETALRVGAPLAWVQEPIGLPVGLAGSHQRWNAALAVAALEAAQVPITPEAIACGLREVVWPGRFERIPHDGVELILDGAHNEPAALRLAETWREEYGDERPVLLLGVLQDKDVESIARALVPRAGAVVAASVASPRACPAGTLAETIRTTAPGVNITLAASVPEGLRQAVALAQAGRRRVLVAGSLFLIGEALASLRGGSVEKSAQ